MRNFQVGKSKIKTSFKTKKYLKLNEFLIFLNEQFNKKEFYKKYQKKKQKWVVLKFAKISIK